MWGWGKRSLVAALVVFNCVATTQPVQANVSLCELLLSGAQSAHISYRHGEDGHWISDALDQINSDQLHPSYWVRRRLFRSLLVTLQNAQSLELNAKPQITAFVGALYRYAPEEIAVVARFVAQSPLRHTQDPERAIESILRNTLTHSERQRIDAQYTWLNGWRVTRESLVQVRRIRSRLEDCGILSQPVPTLGDHGERLAVLQVDSIRPLAHLRHGHLLTEQFLHSDQAERFLSEMQNSDGTLIIDPWQESLAYFHRLPQGHPLHTGWIIAIKQDTSTITFEHEWQHKRDLLQSKDAYAQQLLLARNPNRTAADLGPVASIGHTLENEYWCEVIATQHEMNLMHGKVSPHHEEYCTARAYHRMALRQVAWGRILQQPLHAGHYWLWLRSWWAGRPRR